MGKTTNDSKRIMLDDIQRYIRVEYIPEDQFTMIAKDTNGRRGNMLCKIYPKDEEILLCSFDQEGDNCVLFPYFKEERGLVSMCDYILFVEDDEKMFVFLIELKDTAHRSKRQTCISQTFAEFLIKRIMVIKDETCFSKPVEYRKIGIKSTCSKMTTKGYETMIYDKDGYTVLPDYHRFYIKRMKELVSE